MDSKKTARQILKLIGGTNDMEHCSTRLQLSLKDNRLGEQPQIKKMHGIIGGSVHSQFQIVIDKKVSNVCDAIKGLVEGKQTAGDKTHTKKKWGAVIVDFLISVFQALVTAIAGGGILKLLLIILAMVGG
jgi:PTS system beta-glucosides-specific IIC component